MFLPEHALSYSYVGVYRYVVGRKALTSATIFKICNVKARSGSRSAVC